MRRLTIVKLSEALLPTEADLWMRKECGAHTKTFQLPVERDEAIAFETEAKKNKFSIDAYRNRALVVKNKIEPSVNWVIS
jgi:hypothetical protein